MVYGCGATCVKALIFIFNFLSFLAGGALLGLSVTAYVKGNFGDLDKEVTDVLHGVDRVADLKNVAIAGIVIGGVIMLISFFGCCGAIMESQCLLGLFATCMVILICGQIVIGALILVYRGRISETVQKSVQEMHNNVTNPTTDQSTRERICNAYVVLNTNTICCGNDGKGEPGCTNPRLLPTDCKKDLKCTDELPKFVTSVLNGAGIAILVVIALELLAFSFAIGLCCAIRKGKYVY